jgi:1-acyl-sn-glycerol-3-phosphate acyltransferase
MNLARALIIWPVLIILFLILFGICIALIFQVSFLVGVAMLMYFITPVMDDLLPIRNFIENLIKSARIWTSNKLSKDCLVEGLKESLADKRTQNGIYICHPHGFLALAPFVHFSLGEEQIGLITTPIMFTFPIFGWLLRQLGLIPSDRESIEAASRVAVLLGGGREAHATRAGKMRLCVDRKGIFEIAVKQRRHLIPVLSYGENEIFSIPEGGLLGDFQGWIKEKFHCVLMFPKPADIWEWVTGKNTIKTYVGEPIEPAATWEETRERYIGVLKDLYKKTRPPEYDEEIEFIWRDESAKA